MSEKGMNREEMQESIRLMTQNYELVEAGMRPIAEMFKAKFDSFVKAGFDEDQAMELLCARGLNA